MARLALGAIGLISTLLLCISAWAAEPSEADQQRADAAYARAVKHYKAGEFSYAAAAFQEAYDAVQDAALLWNVGISHEKSGELAQAKDVYQRFLASQGGDPRLRSKAGEALVRVGSKLAAMEAAKTAQERERQLLEELEHAKASDNAELTAKLQQQLEVERQAIAEEKRRVEAERAELAAQEQELVALEVKYKEAINAPSAAGWTLFGAGLAAALAGGGLLVAAEVQRGDLDRKLDPSLYKIEAISQSDAFATRDEADTFELAGAISLSVGAAAAVTGVIVLLATGGGADAEDNEARSMATPHVSPLADGRGAVVGVGGTF